MKNNPRSTLVYLILAQPMKDNVEPFILQVFGTDNKFKTNDVLQRWQHTRDQLARYIFLLCHHIYIKIYIENIIQQIWH